MKDLLIVATSALKPSQEKLNHSSDYPQVEYVHLAHRLDADYINYSLYDRLPFKSLIRRFETKARSDISLALAALWRAKNYRAVLAMSERVGILLALFKRMGLLKPKLIFRFTAWSHRQESLFKKFNLLPFADHIVVESSRLGEHLVEHFGVKKEQLSFVPYSIDTHFFSSRQTSEQAQSATKKIFSAGEKRGRDYDTLLKAVAGLDKIETTIAASGTWFAREKDDQLAAQLPENVELTGHLNITEMRQKYAEADYVVVPLCNEIFSAGVTVTLEAFAMGKPVIVTQSNGLRDYLIDEENCLLVPVEDPVKLQQAISHLKRHPEVADRLAANGRETAEKRFSMSQYVVSFQTVLEKVLRSNHNGRLPSNSELEVDVDIENQAIFQ